MTTTVADQLLARLREWDVRHVFGYPGDGINGILGAFSRADDQPRFIQSRHEEMTGAWQRALSANRPTVLDVYCDPDVPPIPPHSTLEQMTDMAKALIKGDTSRWGVIKEGRKTKAQEFIPHRQD